MLHKLAKFHHQTIFTSQVIQQNVLHVSSLAIWWRHDIWIFEVLKSDYLKNKKSLQSEIKKKIFQKCSLLEIKQTSKNEADTTFNKSFPLTHVFKCWKKNQRARSSALFRFRSLSFHDNPNLPGTKVIRPWLVSVSTEDMQGFPVLAYFPKDTNHLLWLTN